MLRKVHVRLLCVLLGFLAGCGANGDNTPNVAEQTEYVSTSIARMYVPQCRSELDPLSQFDKLLSAVPTEGLDPAILSELTAELRRALENRGTEKTASTPPKGEENMVDVVIAPDGEGGEQLEWSYVNNGDYDQNGEVGVSDLTPIVIHYGIGEGQPGWEQARIADGDGNGETNISDVTPIAIHFGAACMGYNIYGRDGVSGPYTLVGTMPIADGRGGSPVSFIWPISVIYEEYVVAAYDFDGIDSPVTPIVKSNVTVIDQAEIVITDRTEDTVTLSGDTSALTPGQVMVSGEGEGFLGVVESVDTSGANPVVTYTQGTLEDVFDYVEIDFSKAFGFDDIDQIESFEDGIEVVRTTSGAGVSSADKEASKFGDITIKFKEHEFGANHGSVFYGLTLQGEVEFGLDIKAEIKIGGTWTNPELHSCDFGLGAKTKGAVVAKIVVKKKWIGEAKLIKSFHGLPVVIMAGLLPVVFTPQLDIYMGLIGEAEIAATFTPSVTMSASAGLKYTKQDGWDPYFTKDVKGEFGWEQTNIYGKLQLDLNLLSPQPTVKLYGITGPYAKFHAPYFRVAAQVQTTPPEFSVTGSIGGRAYVGAEIGALGHTLARYELGGEPLFNVLFQLFQAKWPLDGNHGSLLFATYDDFSGEPVEGVGGKIVSGSAESIALDWRPRSDQIGKESLAPGSYYVQLYKEGYKFAMRNVNLAAEQNLMIPVMLEPGSAAETMRIGLTYAHLPTEDEPERYWMYPRCWYYDYSIGEGEQVDLDDRGNLGAMPFMAFTGAVQATTKSINVSQFIQPESGDLDDMMYGIGIADNWHNHAGFSEFATARLRIWLDDILVINILMQDLRVNSNVMAYYYPGTGEISLADDHDEMVYALMNPVE